MANNVTSIITIRKKIAYANKLHAMIKELEKNGDYDNILPVLRESVDEMTYDVAGKFLTNIDSRKDEFDLRKDYVAK